MNNVLTMSKKALTWGVVVTAILWSMSAAFVVAPLTAKAATPLAAGDLIRGTEKSPYGGWPVFFYGADGKKSLFSTGETYKTWYPDFSKVKVITEAELKAIPGSDKNVTFRPGVSVIKFESESNLYVVEKGAVIRKVSDAVAKELYGASYEAKQIPSAFRANYKSGADVNTAADYNKTAAMAASPDISTDMGGPSVVTPVGAVSVSIASDNPAGAVLPTKASGVTLMKFNLASSSGATVTGINMKRSGVGATSDFANLYLYDGAKRLTTGRSIQSTTQEVQFTNLNLAIGAGTTKTLSLVGDVSTSAVSGDTHGFMVTSAASAASVSGLPISGSTFSIGSQSVSTLKVTKGSTPADPTIGQKSALVSEFKLEAGTNDVAVSRVTLIQGGDIANTDLSNLELWQGGAKIASVAAMSGDKMHFVLDAPMTIPQGTTRIFQVKADVAGRGGRTIKTYVEYAADVYAMDKVYNFGAFVDTGTTGTFDGVSTNHITVTAKGGKATIAFNGPSAADVSVGTQDALVYKFSLTAGDQALDIRNVRFTMTGSANVTDGTTPYFTDVALKNMDTGARIDTKEITGVAGTTKTFTFNNSFIVAAGATVNLGITTDVRNVSTFSGQNIKMTLNAFQSGDVKEVNTNQNVTDIVPSADIQGYAQTVRASALTVQVASTPVSNTTVKGSKGVEVVGYSFAAGSQSDVKVTSLVLYGAAKYDTDADNSLVDESILAASLDDVVLSASLWVDGLQIGTAKAPSSTGTMTFDSLNWTIPAGQTKKLTVKADVSTSIAGLANQDATFAFGVPQTGATTTTTSDLSAQDKDSNTVSATDGSGDWTTPVNGYTTHGGVVVTVKDGGSLAAALDGDTPKSTIVLGSTTDVTMLKVKFTSTNESFWIKKLRIINDSANDDTGINDTGITQIKLTYPKQDGTTETKTAILSSAVADVSDLNFYAPVNKDVVLTVAADFGDIAAAGITGDTPRFSLDYDSNFEAVGAGSGKTLSSVGGANIDGNAMVVRKTKPTVTLAASSPAGAGVPGLNDVLRFTVGADAKGSLDLKTLTFAVTSTANAAGSNAWNTPRGGTTGTPGSNGSGLWTSDFNLYDSADMSTAMTGTWTLYDSAGNALANSSVAVVAYAEFHLTTPQAIGAGTSKTFVLRVDTTGASSASDDTVRFDVADETVLTPKFIWNETGPGANTATLTDAVGTIVGISGQYVKNLIVNGGTIVY